MRREEKKKTATEDKRKVEARVGTCLSTKGNKKKERSRERKVIYSCEA